MTEKRHEQLGMLDNIERRDFINGVLKSSLVIATSGLASNVLAAAAGMPAPPSTAGAASTTPGTYPPALTGMRGSGYPKAFAVGHEMRDGTLHIDEARVEDTGEEYDLVVVGGGISGLSAALYYSQDSGGKARTLVLDNHDDFGGHAKRNEFDFGDRIVMSNAGTFNISPGSENARSFMQSIGIDDIARLNRDNQDTFFYQRLGMGQSVYYDQATFGKDLLMGDPAPWIEFIALHDPNTPPDQAKRWSEFLARAPMNQQARKDVYRLYTAKTDYLPGMTPAERVKKLRKVTYRDFLLDIAKVDPMAVTYLRDRTFGSARGLSGMSAIAARRRGMPGFLGMDLGPDNPLPPSALSPPAATTHEPIANYHFPDGNATIARLIVRQLIPESLPGKTLEDSILQRADYSCLDLPANRNRIRLNSTAVRVANTPSGVSVLYSCDGKIYRVRARHCVLACWHHVIPYICQELPDWQKQALRYQVHAANLWVNVWLRNWRAFHKAGACFINAPNGYYSQILLECPVDIGGYKRSTSPNEPTVLTMLRVFETPGVPVKDQYRIARAEMYGTDFKTYEFHVRDQLSRMLGPYGFDARRDIAGITVNRWGHGYSYMYSSVFDEFLDRGEQPPHERARMPYGNIAIANCDAAARDSTPDAIDQARRAVGELRLNMRNSVAF
ncbi:MAG: NAD(P)-binding protein [Proteobacteria bacterium]|nr:NAD(P)-binding protein [Pseudomonadota bacterium]